MTDAELDELDELAALFEDSVEGIAKFAELYGEENGIEQERVILERLRLHTTNLLGVVDKLLPDPPTSR